jgi:PPIC-type PPIASE domain
VAVAGVCMARTLWLAPAAAQPNGQPAAVRPQTLPPPTPGSVSEYTASIVASFNEHSAHSVSITREDLGEHLIARRGVEKLDTLINNRIIEKVCKERGIEVNASEIEQRLDEDLKGVNIDRAQFVKQFLRRANKNLTEWRLDVLRPQLLLTKLCRDRVTVTEQEIRDGFEARFGEKVDCRVIHWADEKQAQAEYAKIRDDEQAFIDAAKHQQTSALAATGGKIAAFGHHNMDNVELEKAAFNLQPGEVSPLVKVPDGWIVIRCDGRIPADPAATLDKVKAAIKDEIQESKVQKEIKTIMATLRKEADPQSFLEKPGAALDAASTKAGHAPGSAVATIYGTIPITRQDLGDFLITRFGAEQLDLLVNKRLLQEASRACNITVTEDEIEATFVEDYRKQKLTSEADFVEKYLKPNKTTAYQWREDVVRPRLMLAKLCRDRIHVTEEDLRAAFDAYHGEKVECRMILYPQDGMNAALQNYAKLRDDDKEFDQAARTQMSPSLAQGGGRMTIGRHTSGDDRLERKAFALQPGEVSELFGTAQGIVLLKCDCHVPPDTSVSFADCRATLEREVIERKTQLEMPVCFAELRKLAAPRLLLHDPNRPEQLREQVEAEVKDVNGPSKK